jgi:hypothetical protein
MTRYATIALILAASPALAHHEEVQTHLFAPSLGIVLMGLAAAALIGFGAVRARARAE